MQFIVLPLGYQLDSNNKLLLSNNFKVVWQNIYISNFFNV